MSHFFSLTRRLPVVGAAATGLFFLQACSTGFLASDLGETALEDKVISMSYEAAMYTYRTLGSGATNSDLEKIRSMVRSGAK